MIFMTRRTLVRTAALETGMMLVAPLLAAETKPLTGAELQKEAVSISKVPECPLLRLPFRLRCPVSPNLTLYDSESAIANELKGVIYEKLRAGETREQIFDFMVARYGEQIRYEPDMNAGTAALWAAPWVALGACGLFLAARMRRKGAKADRA